MRLLLFFSFMALAGLINAQDASSSANILSRLKGYNISLTDLTLHAQPMPKDFAFDMTVETPDDQYPVTYKATYDPTKSPAWEMVSWNGTKPDNAQKGVLKHRTERYAVSPVVVDESTLKSAREGDFLVVSFRIDPLTAPREYMYLKDCDGKAYINSAGVLEKTVWDNFQPTKNQSIRVKKLHEEVFFVLTNGVYHVSKETQYMGGNVNTKVGDVSGSADQTITYTNYRKVK
jgi:hypothetical protein